MRVIEPPERQVGDWNDLVCVRSPGNPEELGYLQWRYHAGDDGVRRVMIGAVFVDGLPCTQAVEAGKAVGPVCDALFRYAIQRFADFQVDGDVEWVPGADGNGNPGKTWRTSGVQTHLPIPEEILPYAEAAVAATRGGGRKPSPVDAIETT